MSDIRYHDDHDWLSCIEVEEDFCCGDCKICYQVYCEDRYEPIDCGEYNEDV